MENSYKLYKEDVSLAISKINSIINSLKKNDNLKNTIIIVYGDHGEGFDHNYYFHHGYMLYNSAVHIPFILYHPDMFSRNVNQTITNNDILPSLLDLLGIPYEADHFDGKSFSYLLRLPSIITQFFPSRNKYTFFIISHYLNLQFSMANINIYIHTFLKIHVFIITKQKRCTISELTQPKKTTS